MGKIKRKKIVFISFAIILIIVVVELEARLLAPEYKAIKFRFEPYPYLPYIPKPDFRTDRDYSFGILFGYPAQHNSLGFRGDELQSNPSLRIACFGGSSTYCAEVSKQKNTWPYRLQTELRKYFKRNDIETINVGAMNYTTNESLISYIIRVRHLKPDIVIVYHAYNDMYYLGCPESFFSENYVKIKRKMPDFESVERLDKLLSHSRFLHLLFKASIVPRLNLKWVVDKADWDSLDKQTLERSLKHHPGNFEDNLVSFVVLSKKFGSKIILCTQAFCPQKHPYPLLYAQAMKRMNDIIKKVAQREGADLVDLDSALSYKENYFSDVLHLNDSGADYLAEILEKYIASKYQNTEQENRLRR